LYVDYTRLPRREDWDKHFACPTESRTSAALAAAGSVTVFSTAIFVVFEIAQAIVTSHTHRIRLLPLSTAAFAAVAAGIIYTAMTSIQMAATLNHAPPAMRANRFQKVMWTCACETMRLSLRFPIGLAIALLLCQWFPLTAGVPHLA
jgi:hypothetical protein